ncbi:MAG: tetratricopeptide repeat protein [Sphaerochaetaceae bacterium]|nr:tetratricopeptide repeat protein [Spirochaetales bacterium]MDY5500300.1 tetratricopeptide repeat protein [Sphaerochaetaceae bacterium]
MKKQPLDDIVYITLPPSMARDINGFRLDPARELPIQLPAGKKHLDGDTQVTLDMIVSGMLRIICYQADNPNFPYYKQFVLAAEPDAVEQLNLAAIAQEKAGHDAFAEELFLTVNHLYPQSATFINLATCYSQRAASDKEKGTVYDMYAQKALDTLMEGVRMFPKDPDLLCEVGYFHLYQGNTETAEDYFEQYLAVAPQGEKRSKVEKVFADINKKISNDTALMHAYDQISMGEEDKALETLKDWIVKNPKTWNGYFLQGWALRKLGRFDEARESFLTCLNLGQKDGDIYNELSLCEFSLGNKPLAKDYLDIAVDLDGKNLTYLSNLAYMHLEDEEYGQARRLLEKARALDSSDPLIQQLMRDYTTKTGDELGQQPTIEQVVDDETLKAAVKKHDDEETRHAFAAHEDGEEEHHHHDEDEE